MDEPSAVPRAVRGRPRLGSRAPLSRSQVVEEALRLCDEEGASALTMRKLSARLGVEAMSLYAYVTDKDDLLDAVADRVADGLVLAPAPRHDWQGRIRAVVWAWVAMEQAHPGAFPLLYRRRRATERERAATEEIMDALAEAGFDEASVALTYQTLISFLDGALLHWPPSTWQTTDAWENIADTVDAARYPRTAATAPHAAQLSWDDIFSTGLELFLRGLIDTLASSAARGSRTP